MHLWKQFNVAHWKPCLTRMVVGLYCINVISWISCNMWSTECHCPMMPCTVNASTGIAPRPGVTRYCMLDIYMWVDIQQLHWLYREKGQICPYLPMYFPCPLASKSAPLPYSQPPSSFLLQFLSPSLCPRLAVLKAFSLTVFPFDSHVFISMMTSISHIYPVE